MDDSLLFVGTATTVIRLGGFTLLTDPNFLHRGQLAWLGKGLVSRRRSDPALQVGELPPLDAVVLSHLHGDHWDRVARRGLDRALPVLTTRHAARRLRPAGFDHAVALEPWQTHTVTKGRARLRVTALPATHARGLLGRLLPPVIGTLLEVERDRGATPYRIYISGDTLYDEQLRAVRDLHPDLAVLHLGGTRILGRLVTMDAEQGADLLELVRPGHAVPVHLDDYGVFKSSPAAFRQEIARRGLADRVTMLARGERIALPVPAAG